MLHRILSSAMSTVTMQTVIFTVLAVCLSITPVSRAEQVTAIKENSGMSVAAYSDSSQSVNQPVSCSICNSMPTDGLSPSEIRRIGAVGHECVTNPKKFVQPCDQWRASYDFDHPLNKTIKFTGCYKTIFTYEHDVEGNTKTEDRVVRSCGFLGTPGCFNAPGYGTTQRICFCKGPECNGSASLMPGLIIFISLALSSVLLRL